MTPTINPPDRPLAPVQARLLVGCLVGLATGFAGLYFSTLTIFLKPIAAEFDWSRANTSAALLMSMLGLAIGSPIQGQLIDRFGAQRVIAGSVIGQAAALAALSLIPGDPVWFGLICLLIGAAGVATGPNGYLSLLPSWFDRRLGLALSCAMVGVGVGAALFPRQIQLLVQAHGWRTGYLAVAGISLVGGLVAVAITAVGAGPLDQPRSSARRARPGLSFREGVRDRRLILIAIALGLGGAAGLGVAIHLAPMLDDRGFSAGQIAATVSLSGVGLMVGRLIGGALMDVMPARLVAAMTYMIGAVAIAVLGLDLTRAFPIVAAGGFFLGVSLGTEGDFAAFAVRRYLGLRAFSGLYGVVFMSYSVGSVAGVILCGRAFDQYGNYSVASLGCIAAMAVAVIVVSLLGDHRFAADTNGSVTEHD